MSSSRSLDRLGFVLFHGLAVAPIVASLGYAALYALGLTGLLSRGFTLAHARAVFVSTEVWASIALSIGVAGAVVGLTVAAALPLSLILRRRLEQGRLASVLCLPLALPGLVAAVVFLQLFSASGPVSRLVFRLGLTSGMAGFPSPVQDAWGAGIVLTHAALAVPFFILLFAEIHQREKVPALVELAVSLGASPGQGVRRVVVPLLLRQAAPSLALLFVVVLGSYEIPLVLGRPAPQMLSLLVLRRYAMFDIALKPEAFVLALVYTALVLTLLAVAFRGSRRHR